MTQRIHQIGRLLGAVKARELARLAAINQRQERVEILVEENRKEIANLRRPTHVANAAHWDQTDKRHRFLLLRNQDLNLQLAGLAAEVELQKIRSKIAVGKCAAFDRFLEPDPVNEQPFV